MFVVLRDGAGCVHYPVKLTLISKQYCMKPVLVTSCSTFFSSAVDCPVLQSPNIAHCVLPPCVTVGIYLIYSIAF